MINNHLTDEAIQTYLLKEVQDDAITKHLAECSICKIKLKEYDLLINNMQKIKTETFSFDVTSLVMEKIIEVETQKEKKANAVLYISLSSVLIIAMFLLYPSIKTIFIQFKTFSIIGNAFMIVSVLGVVVFLLNDLFRQYKQKEMLLSQ